MQITLNTQVNMALMRQTCNAAMGAKDLANMENLHQNYVEIAIHNVFYTLIALINNYSPKWRWLAVDIYRAAERRGKYPTLATDTEVNSCFSIY